MFDLVRKSALGAAALGALGLGGAALAGAAGNNATGTSGTATAQQRAGQPQQDQLSSAGAAKVKAAALDKVPGATVLRTEAGGPYGAPYHAHIRTTGGKLEVVLVNSSFDATAVQADNGRGGPGGHRGGRHGGPGGGPGHGETALTGDTKDRVEAAVKARYSGATIIRTETNADGSAPYESHIKTSDGKQLEVHVSKDFEVVDAREQGARP